MALERWQVGEQKAGIPAATWNAFVDNADKAARTRSRTPIRDALDPAHVLSFTAYNATGVSVSPGEIVSIGTVRNYTSDNSPIVVAGTPYFNATRNHSATAPLAVVLEGGKVAAQPIRVATTGYVWAKVLIKAANDTIAGPGSTTASTLTSGKPGCRLHWKSSSSVGSTVWCVVELNAASASGVAAVGELVGDHLPPGVWDRASGTKTFTPGTASLAKVRVWRIENSAAVPVRLVYEKTAADAIVELPAINYTLSKIYNGAVPGSFVFGRRIDINGVEHFAVEDNLRGSVIHGTAAGAVSSAASSFTVNVVSPSRVGSMPLQLSGAENSQITAQNDFGFTIDAGGSVRCEQNDDGTWTCVQAECPA